MKQEQLDKFRAIVESDNFKAVTDDQRREFVKSYTIKIGQQDKTKLFMEAAGILDSEPIQEQVYNTPDVKPRQGLFDKEETKLDIPPVEFKSPTFHFETKDVEAPTANTSLPREYKENFAAYAKHNASGEGDPITTDLEGNDIEKGFLGLQGGIPGTPTPKTFGERSARFFHVFKGNTKALTGNIIRHIGEFGGYFASIPAQIKDNLTDPLQIERYTTPDYQPTLFSPDNIITKGGKLIEDTVISTGATLHDSGVELLKAEGPPEDALDEWIDAGGAVGASLAVGMAAGAPLGKGMAIAAERVFPELPLLARFFENMIIAPGPAPALMAEEGQIWNEVKWEAAEGGAMTAIGQIPYAPLRVAGFFLSSFAMAKAQGSSDKEAMLYGLTGGAFGTAETGLSQGSAVPWKLNLHDVDYIAGANGHIPELENTVDVILGRMSYTPNEQPTNPNHIVGTDEGIIPGEVLTVDDTETISSDAYKPVLRALIAGVARQKGLFISDFINTKVEHSGSMDAFIDSLGLNVREVNGLMKPRNLADTTTALSKMFWDNLPEVDRSVFLDWAKEKNERNVIIDDSGNTYISGHGLRTFGLNFTAYLKHGTAPNVALNTLFNLTKDFLRPLAMVGMPGTLAPEVTDVMRQTLRDIPDPFIEAKRGFMGAIYNLDKQDIKNMSIEDMNILEDNLVRRHTRDIGFYGQWLAQPEQALLTIKQKPAAHHYGMIIEGSEMASVKTKNSMGLLAGIQNSLKSVDRQLVRKYMDAKHAGDWTYVETIDRTNPTLAKAANGIESWLGGMRETVKDYMRRMMVLSGDSKVLQVQSDVNNGVPVDEALAARKVDPDKYADFLDDLTDIDNWGLDDYIPNLMVGRLWLRNSDNEIVIAAHSKRDLQRQIKQAQRNYPERLRGTLTLQTSAIQDHAGMLNIPKFQLQSYQNMLDAQVESVLAEIDGMENAPKVKAEATKIIKEAMKRTRGKIISKEPKAGSSFTKKDEKIALGEMDLFDILGFYAHSVHTLTELGPVQYQVEKFISKELSKEQPNIAQHLRDGLADALGSRRSDFEKAYDKFMLKLGRGQSALRRDTSKLRWLQGQTKLGYNTAGAIVNLMSGQQHILVKMGTRAWAEGVAFSRTEEGNAIFESQRPFMGLDYGSMVSGNDEVGRTTSKARIPSDKEAFDIGRGSLDYMSNKSLTEKAIDLAKPSGIFTAPEGVNRKTAFLSAYKLYLKQHPNDVQGALQFGRYMVRATEFVYNTAALPKILRGPVTKTLGQFRSYMLNEISFMRNLTPKEFVRLAFWQTVMFGPRTGARMLQTVPLIGEGLALGVIKFLDQARKKMEEEGLPDVTSGLPGLVGVDMSRQAAMMFPKDTEEFVYGIWGRSVSEFMKLHYDFTDFQALEKTPQKQDYVNYLMGEVPALQTLKYNLPKYLKGNDWLTDFMTEDGKILNKNGKMIGQLGQQYYESMPDVFGPTIDPGKAKMDLWKLRLGFQPSGLSARKNFEERIYRATAQKELDRKEVLKRWQRFVTNKTSVANRSPKEVQQFMLEFTHDVTIHGITYETLLQTAEKATIDRLFPLEKRILMESNPQSKEALLEALKAVGPAELRYFNETKENSKRNYFSRY